MPLLAMIVGVLLSWATLEVSLRALITRMPYDLGLKLFGCYDMRDSYHTVYANHPSLHVRVMKPRFETTCVFNRHAWHHQGDAWGFRNPETSTHADVVLLGDSITYGHGVEEPATIAHYLRADLSTTVANLGVTAAGLTDYVALLRNFALRLSPKVVVVLAFANDIADIAGERNPDEQQAFVEGRPVPELTILPRSQLLQGIDVKNDWSVDRVARNVLAYQTYLFFTEGVDAPPQGRETPARPSTPVLRLEEGEPVANLVGGALSVAYAEKALRVMQISAQQAGVRLVLGYLPELDPRNQRRDDAMERLLGDMAKTLGMLYMDLRPVLSAPDHRAYPGDRLARDGHLTAAGSERTARGIARYLVTQNLLPRP